MKIRGIERVVTPTVDVAIGKAPDGKIVSLTLKAPTFTEIRRILDELPAPKPNPSGVERDERNRIRRDDKGVPIPKYDYDDPKYKADVQENAHARMVAEVLACISNGDIELATRREDHPKPVNYYLAVLREMEDFGVDVAALQRMENAMKGLMELTPDEVEGAMDALGIGGEPGEDESRP